MATSVRMDIETERLLDRLAREEGVSKSEVIRKAIRLAAGKARPTRGVRPYDAFREVLGSVKGGRSDLSESTGRTFARLLGERKATRS